MDKIIVYWHKFLRLDIGITRSLNNLNLICIGIGGVIVYLYKSAGLK